MVKKVLVIVAHPDDETLWSGGTILMHPNFDWFIISLCRKMDPDRAPKFYKAVEILNAKGIMGVMDDGPEQFPLEETIVEKTLLELLPNDYFDVIITHDPQGEYTRHRRHEEVSRAVIKLWYFHKIHAGELWTYAYEDGNKTYYPKPVENSSIFNKLHHNIWKKKYDIITKIYGFQPGSFEAETTPKAEAFRKFRNPAEAYRWLIKKGNLESTKQYLN